MKTKTNYRLTLVIAAFCFLMAQLCFADWICSYTKSGEGFVGFGGSLHEAITLAQNSCAAAWSESTCLSANESCNSSGAGCVVYKGSEAFVGYGSSRGEAYRVALQSCANSWSIEVCSRGASQCAAN